VYDNLKLVNVNVVCHATCYSSGHKYTIWRQRWQSSLHFHEDVLGECRHCSTHS